jgi:hypothetical protein
VSPESEETVNTIREHCYYFVDVAELQIPEKQFPHSFSADSVTISKYFFTFKVTKTRAD